MPSSNSKARDSDLRRFVADPNEATARDALHRLAEGMREAALASAAP
jgi:hypothetical protein